jgi:hypothetical protein
LIATAITFRNKLEDVHYGSGNRIEIIYDKLFVDSNDRQTDTQKERKKILEILY